MSDCVNLDQSNKGGSTRGRGGRGGSAIASTTATLLGTLVSGTLTKQ